jgi:hypothetical protein
MHFRSFVAMASLRECSDQTWHMHLSVQTGDRLMYRDGCVSCDEAVVLIIFWRMVLGL